MRVRWEGRGGGGTRSHEHSVGQSCAVSSDDDIGIRKHLIGQGGSG